MIVENDVEADRDPCRNRPGLSPGFVDRNIQYDGARTRLVIELDEVDEIGYERVEEQRFGMYSANGTGRRLSYLRSVRPVSSTTTMLFV